MGKTVRSHFLLALLLPLVLIAPTYAATGTDTCTQIVSSRLSVFTEVVRSQNKNTGIFWNSKVLQGNTPLIPQRTRFIIAQLMDKTSVLSQEVSKVLSDLKINPSRFWDTFLRVYDRVVPFCDGYKEIGSVANRILPLAGRIGDFGIGTANLATLLTVYSTDRQIVGIDSSPAGLSIARDKLTSVLSQIQSTSAPRHFELILGDVVQTHLAPGSLDGAVMNNVLYSIADSQRFLVLKEIFEALKPGAYLVLNDPRALHQKDNSALGNFLTSVANSAAANNAPMSEYDFAFLSHINFQFLAGGATTFLSPDQLKEKAEQTGFIVESLHESYYGNGTLLILKKP